MKKRGTFLFYYVNSHIRCHEEFEWEFIYKTGTYCHYTALKQGKKLPCYKSNVTVEFNMLEFLESVLMLSAQKQHRLLFIARNFNYY